jgi:hypothetical protein
VKRRFLASLAAAVVLPSRLVRAKGPVEIGSPLGPAPAPLSHMGSDLSASFTRANGAPTALTLGTRAAQFISAKDFGAKGDGVTDDTAAIQAAIDWAIYQNHASQNSLGSVLIPAGTYRVSDTIHLGYGTSYSGVVLQGQGMKYAGASNMSGTALVATFADRPLLNIQGARNSAVRDIALVGLNHRHVAEAKLGDLSRGSGAINDILDASWVDPSLPSSATSRYSPYCGIAIDAYSGSRPPMSYPEVSYPAFLGAVSQYHKNFSSNVLIENVSIAGFVVGVVNQPCDADGNGDFTKLRRVQISHCQYGISICNTQSRLVHVQDSTLVKVHTALVTDKHGRQNGCSEILFEGTELSNLIYWHQISNTAFAVGPRFEFCRGEVVYAIGNLSRGARTSSSTTYDHCYFGFDGRQARGQPIWTLTNAEGMVTFDSCTFKQPAGAGPVHLQGDAGLYRIVNCNQLFGLNATEAYEKQALNATCAFTFSSLRARLAEFSCRNAAVWDLDRGSLGHAAMVGSCNTGPRNLLVPFYSDSVRSASRGDVGIPAALESSSAEEKARIRGDIAVSGRDVTFTSSRNEDRLINEGGANGDIVYDDATGIIFYVRSRNGSTITMRAQTGYDSSGRLLAPISKRGNFWYQNCRAYSPLTLLQGDVNTNNATVSRVGTDDDPTFREGTIVAGDYVGVSPAIDNWIRTVGGGNMITATNSPGGSFVLASSPLKAQTRRRFAIFYRAEPANN